MVLNYALLNLNSRIHYHHFMINVSSVVHGRTAEIVWLATSPSHHPHGLNRAVEGLPLNWLHVTYHANSETVFMMNYVHVCSVMSCKQF